MVVMGASPLFGPSGPSPVARAQPSLSLNRRGIDPVGLNAQSSFQVATQASTRGGTRVATLTPTSAPTAHPAAVAMQSQPSASPSAVTVPSAADVGPSPSTALVASSGGGGGGGSTDASASPTSAAGSPVAGPSASTSHGIPFLVPIAIAGVAIAIAGAIYFAGRKKHKNPSRGRRSRRRARRKNPERLRFDVVTGPKSKPGVIDEIEAYSRAEAAEEFKRRRERDDYPPGARLVHVHDEDPG